MTRPIAEKIGWEYWQDNRGVEISLPGWLKLRVCAYCDRGTVHRKYRISDVVDTLVARGDIPELGPFLGGRPVCVGCWDLVAGGQRH